MHAFLPVECGDGREDMRRSGRKRAFSSSSLLLMFLCSFLPRAHTCSVMYHQLVKGICSDGRLQALQEIRYVHCTYMIKSCTCICKGRQDKVRYSPKADSEKKH